MVLQAPDTADAAAIYTDSVWNQSAGRRAREDQWAQQANAIASQRNRSPGRHRHHRHSSSDHSDSGRRDKTPGPNSGPCFYHRRYGKKARKCESSCTMVGNGTAASSN